MIVCNYREKKAVPFVEKMKDILFSLYRDYCDLQSKYQRLVRDFNNIRNREERLQERCSALGQRVEELENVDKDYGRIR